MSNLWWAQNNNIFNNKLIPPEVVAKMNPRMVENYKAEIKSKEPIIPLMAALNYEIPQGFFDGSC